VPFAERLAEKAETSARRASPRRRRKHPLDGFEASEIVELLRLLYFLMQIYRDRLCRDLSKRGYIIAILEGVNTNSVVFQ
jgi:hypothetical protein